MVELTATVSPGALDGVSPTGTVSFYSSSMVLPTALLSKGPAVLTLKPTTAGVLAIYATYNGDTNFLASKSAMAQLTVTAP